MLKNIPQNRLLLYIMLVGLIPLLFVAMQFITRQREIDTISNTLAHVQQKAYSFEKKQANNVAVRNHYRNADHFYIDKALETLIFLKPEIENLTKITEDKNFTSDKSIEKRLQFLKGTDNHLSFIEGIVQSYPHFQETVETLAHPVEVNVENIKEILAKIEGVQVGSFEPSPNRPQLIILDFKLDKKKGQLNNDVYSLNMKLLKREFT